MIVRQTPLAGAFVIEPELHCDERGFFTRTFCRETLAERGIAIDVVQCNLSQNHVRGTLRGMHFQLEPHAEQKLVFCVRGAVFDVIVDLRSDSPTRGQWHAVELTADNRCILYIPQGIAHGFQTLADDTELFYQMGQNYSPAHARGFRYDDPAIGIDWPLPVRCISERDRKFGPAPEFRNQIKTCQNTTASATRAAAMIEGAIS